MNNFSKRLIQMGALYAAKKLWSSIDQEAAREFAHGVYTTSPREWEHSARVGAMHQLDSMLHGVGLTRTTDARHSQVTSTVMGVAAGVTVGVTAGVAGTFFLLKSETGQNLVRKMQSLLTTRKEANGEEESIVAADEGVEDDAEMKNSGTRWGADVEPNGRRDVAG